MIFYEVAEMLVRQDDVKVIAVKDYIKIKAQRLPQLSHDRGGSRIFTDSKRFIRVEVQIRTIAMDFWASLDHELKYKKVICRYRRGDQRGN